jgi:hypothetical protein
MPVAGSGASRIGAVAAILACITLTAAGPVTAQFAAQAYLDGTASGVPGLRLAPTGLALRGDRLSLVVSQPSRFPGGVTMGSGSGGVDFGGLAIADYGMGLRTGAREVRAELQYFAPLTRSSSLGLSLINRMRPNSDGLAPDERIMMMRFSTQF